MVYSPDEQALVNVLFAYAHSRFTDLVSHMKLAHYTSAENAFKIIDGQTMWLRNAAVMNDHSEIEHGRAILNAALEIPTLGGRFMQVLNRAHPGMGERVIERVRNQRMQARERIFMASLCEIKKDDRLGRLSMWRAYGGKTSGAALVFNSEVVGADLQQLDAVVSPVLYGGLEEFAPKFQAVIEALDRAPQLLGNVEINIAVNAVSWALDVVALSIKHRGFEEEHEWRIIHRPFEYSSAHVKERIASINGTPQLVYEFPLNNIKGMDMPNFNLNSLLDRVIVGPSMYPETTRQALVEALRSKRIFDPESRVVVSDIPLRQTGL